MRCLLCEKLSLCVICAECRRTELKVSLFWRIVGDGFKVYSFYEYSSIKPLLATKYQKVGSSIFKVLAKESFAHFAKNFEYEHKIYAIPIDDDAKKGYSHTAILAKSMESKNIRPIFGGLKAKNRISYAGKDYEFRLNNPRDFRYCGKSGIDAIIIDDIITTGLTMLEAKECLSSVSVNVMFGLVLADAAL